jgi:mycothiol synthase
VPLSVTAAPLDAAARQAVHALAHRIEAEDGAPPLSDQAHSRIGAADGTDLAAWQDGQLVGYARLDEPDAEIAATPEAVPALIEAVLDAAQSAAQSAARSDAHGAAHGAVQIWSHGRRSRLAQPLAAAGFEQIRELYQLRRPLDAAQLPADPPLAEGVTVRTFRPGADDDAWLALNAAAFAGHPEQGSWTHADLDARIAEPWFDADDFLLAERDETLLGFHWTKVHEDGLGEVYVLGVAPQAQGLGLGNGLLVRGLRHLAERGCPQVLLYVDGDNVTARRLYERSGFSEYDRDVQWRRGEM